MAVRLVESLAKGLEILHVFSANPTGLRLPEVTKLTGLPKATAYRFLQTLVSENYLHFFPAAGTFRLGPKVMSLGFGALLSLDIAELAQPYLEELSRRIHQNVNLGTLDGVEVVYLVRIKVRSILGINLTVGSRISACNSAIGKAVLAYLGPEQLQLIIDEISLDPAVAEKIGRNGKLLRQQLAVIRKQGYAVNDGETVPGLASVAAPVRNAKGLVEAAINVPVFTELCSLKTLVEVHLPLLLEIARTISQLRGYQESEERERQAGL
ncbi:MAG: IclR family transcriptional regulator [Thermodesulfobacteriota bacterium]